LQVVTKFEPGVESNFIEVNFLCPMEQGIWASGFKQAEILSEIKFKLANVMFNKLK